MRAKDFIAESTIAWNTDIVKMQPRTQSYATQGAVYRANIQELFNKTPKKVRLNPTDPTGGKNKIGDRVHQAIEFWQHGGSMDPSVISITNGQVNFLDGRHRLVAAAQLGETEAPIIIAPTNHVPEAKKILNLKKW